MDKKRDLFIGATSVRFAILKGKGDKKVLIRGDGFCNCIVGCENGFRILQLQGVLFYACFLKIAVSLVSMEIRQTL